MATNARNRLAPSPRLVDATILALVGFEVCSGLVSLTVGTPEAGWLFVLHGIAGVSLVVLLFWKLRRVRGRVLRWGDRPRGAAVSVLLTLVAVGALATGIAWSLLGVVRVEGFTLLVGHMVLGVLAVPILGWHLRHRFRLPTTSDLAGRRTSLRFGALLVGSAVAWRSKEGLARLLGLAGADRRFTGSKQAGGQGNNFPITSWVADDPAPVTVDEWRLTVAGAVETPTAIGYGALVGGQEPRERESGTNHRGAGDSRTVDSGSVDSASVDSRTGTGARTSLDATLDCTSGWYAERTWTGVPLDRLLDAVGTTDEAAWIRVRSVTGYRWSFPLEEADDLLLATHVDGEALGHGHGAPVRLVAPGRRGFQWVKWVDRVEVTRHEDLSQWVAIFVSGFD